MHDIITEIREKSCVQVHLENKHTRASGNGNNCQPLCREYMKGEEGVWGASAPQKPTE